jgi:predicted nucleic acid-binding protein
MTSCVLDASVAAKWFLPPSGEPHSAEALRILDDYRNNEIRLLVPGLFWPELGNILWKAVRQQRLSQSSAEDAISALDAVQFATTPSRSLWKPAFSIAAAFDRSVYDAVYVALAVLSNAPLVTADERLANALAGRFPIRWLGSW